MNLDILVSNIAQTHSALQQSAAKAINRHLTIRNWLIGFYIFEYEQKGADRAKYGEGLLQTIAERLNNKNLSYRNLQLFRQFYQMYTHIGETVADQLKTIGAEDLSITQTMSAQLDHTDNQVLTIGQTVSAQLEKVHKDPLQVPAHKLISRLSFGHLVELMPIKEPLKRAFYELECMKGYPAKNSLRIL